ncbi:MAG: PEGA domain-containing protein [Defluviitaleaceae bacterium]|nr:PEGA domain-containing protein [Defluviitaleaceae bacterium]
MDEKERSGRNRGIKRDGAEYIPGGHTPLDMGETRKINVADLMKPSAAEAEKTKALPKAKITPKTTTTTKKTPPKKTNYAIIMVTAVFVAVIAVVFVFATMIIPLLNNDGNSGGTVVQGGNDTGNQTSNGNSLEDNVVPVDPTGTNWTGLIQDIRGNRLDVFVFELGEVRSFFAESSSNLRDRLNNPIVLVELSIGDVIEISHAANSSTIGTARLSAEVRSYREITGVSINLEANEITIGNRRYNLQPNPIVRYRGTPTEVGTLDPVDIVTIGIFQDRFVTAIDINRGHGDITIAFDDRIVNPTVEVGNTAFTALVEGGTTLRVPTGEAQVIVRGENIEANIINTNVPRGGTVSVSVNNLEFRSGELIVRTNAENATMYIGDRWYPVNEEISVPFGNHTITIEAPGYQRFEREIEITATSQEIQATLTAEAITMQIMINTSPADARVYIDGEFRGITPLWLDLETGRYTVTLHRMGFLSGNPNPIHITEDGQTIFNYMLAPDPAWPAFN